MRPGGVVVDAPSLDDPARFLYAREQMLIEALIAHVADEALGEAVLLRLAGRDGVPGMERSSRQRRMACEVSSVPLSLTTCRG